MNLNTENSLNFSSAIGSSVKQFLAQKLITEMKHPPYFPALPPNDFWLFSKIKSKGTKISQH
jgi:hypothetical protein